MAGAGGRPAGSLDNPMNKRSRRKPTETQKARQQEKSMVYKAIGEQWNSDEKQVWHGNDRMFKGYKQN